MEIIPLVATFFVGIFTAWFGSMVGSGGLVSIPFLIFMGLPPQIAVATNKLGGFGLAVGAIKRYWKSDKILWNEVIPLCILAVIGSYIGARILLFVNEDILERVIGFILLAVLPFVFLKKEIGTVRKIYSKARKRIGYFLYFLVEIWGGFFGGGGATFLHYVFVMFFGFTVVESGATMKIPGILLSITALTVFVANGIVDYQFGLAIFLGMLIGGWLGAHTALRNGSEWVKGLFAVVVIASAMKLLIF